jgi:uncharacterized membrane protein YdjX (TVP38/TMEM64 family)
MRRLVLLSLVLVGLLVVAYVVQPVSEASVRSWIAPAGGLAPIAYVALAGVLGALLIPGPLLAGASGLLFGTAAGFFVTLAAATVSALLARGAGQRAGRRAFESSAGERTRAAAGTIRRHGVWSVVVQRLIPLVPDGPFNYGFGVAGVAARALVIGTLIGSAPRAFAYTALGDSLDDPASPLALTAVAVVVVTGAIGTVVALRLRRAQARA